MSDKTLRVLIGAFCVLFVSMMVAGVFWEKEITARSTKVVYGVVTASQIHAANKFCEVVKSEVGLVDAEKATCHNGQYFLWSKGVRQ